MRCPWCGSPVMIHGSYWECGWCGDSGRLKRTPVQQPAQITLTLSFVFHVDLPETWKLRAEMPFGSIETPAGEKDYLDDEAVFKLIK